MTTEIANLKTASLATPQMVDPATATRPAPSQQSAVESQAVEDAKKASTPNVDAKVVAAAIEQLNSLAEAQQRHLKFSVDEPSGRTIIKVLDSSSHELIRQIPGDEVLKLAESFESGDTGALMNVVA